MSQLPTGQVGPMSGIRIRRGDDRALGSAIPRVGQTASLGVYGITPDPVDFRADQQAESLMRALGIASRGLEITADEARRQQILREREDAKAEMADRGLAAQRTLEFGPQLLADIQDGRLTPGEDEDALAFASRVINERAAIPEDASPAYRAEINDRLIDRVQTAWLARDRALAAEGRRELTELTVDGVAGKDAESLRSAIAEVRRINPNVSEEAATSIVAARSMEYAATLGDRERFNEAASLVPENSIKRLTAQNTLENTIDRQQRQREDAFNTEIAGLYVDLESGNASYEQVRQTIMASRDRIKNDAVIDRELQRLASREREDLANAYRTSLDIENRRLVNEMESDIATKAIDAFNTGGLGTLTDADLTRTKTVNINGRDVEIEQKITREDAIRVTTERAFAQIDALGLDPEMARDQKIGFLSMNGVAYEPWKRTIETGYVSNIQSLRARTMNGEKVTQLSQSLVDGYALWKDMEATNSPLLGMHAGSEASGFYRFMHTAAKYMTDGDITRAAVMAAATEGKRSFGQISDEMIRKESDWITKGENASDMGAEVRYVAELMLGNGFAPDPETALKEASKHVRTSQRLVGGVWVNMSNRNLAPDFEQSTDFYLDKWATANGEANEVRRKDITLYPASGSDFYVWDKRGNNALALVTANDLAIASEQRRESVRREIEAQQAESLAESMFQSNLSQPQREAMQLAKTYGRAGLAREKRTVAQINAVGDAIGEIKTAIATQSWYEKRPGETDRDYRNRTRRTGGLD